MSTRIQAEHIVASVADALQFISYYHPQDFIEAIYKAYLAETSPSAKSALAQILDNSRMCALGKRPICQDTGIVTVFVKIGMQVTIDSPISLTDLINQGVRTAYTHSENILRASILQDPDGARKNTGDNTPAVIHYEVVAGNTLDIYVAAKGGGSEAKSKFAMLNPSDSVVDWVLKVVPQMGAGWCPPGVLGIGIGGTAEKAMLLAKESLFAGIDIEQLRKKGAQNRAQELRLELFDKVNRLGIGAQGLGGLTTVVDVKVLDFPTHAANKAVAIIPNCAATRHTHFSLDGTGPRLQKAPDIANWPVVDSTESNIKIKKVQLDTLQKTDLQQFEIGDTLLLSGSIYTGRDAAHKRMVEYYRQGKKLPVNLTGKFIYYVGPVDPVGDEVIGPAGPTTATRMDKFTHTILEHFGPIGMIGKAERGDLAIEAIKQHKAIYLIAVGGAAYLVAKAIKVAEVVAFADLGMEAIYRFEVQNMPVTVAVTPDGRSIHKEGPALWRDKIQRLDIN